MSEAARVTSVDAVKEWKDAVCVFHDEATDALGAIEMEIRRAFDWLDQQMRYWQVQVRKREELVLQAKNELTRKKMLPIVGKNPDTTEQEKNLKKAQRRLEEAEHYLEKARKLMPVLRRAVEEYEGPGRQLSNFLEADMGNAIALLDRKLNALDAYLALRHSAPRAAAEEKPPDEAATPSAESKP